MVDNSWTGILERFGISTLILVFIGIALWTIISRAAGWLTPRLERWFTTQQELLSGLKTYLEENKIIQSNQTILLVKMNESEAAESEALARIEGVLMNIHEQGTTTVEQARVIADATAETVERIRVLESKFESK